MKSWDKNKWQVEGMWERLAAAISIAAAVSRFRKIFSNGNLGVITRYDNSSA
jgi:hypothetical protein